MRVGVCVGVGEKRGVSVMVGEMVGVSVSVGLGDSVGVSLVVGLALGITSVGLGGRGVSVKVGARVALGWVRSWIGVSKAEAGMPWAWQPTNSISNTPPVTIQNRRLFMGRVVPVDDAF